MKDIWYTICMFCNRDTLKNIYMLNKKCHELLNEKHTLKQLSFKFNHPYVKNFNTFYNECGQLMVPELKQKVGKKMVAVKEHENGSYITNCNGCEYYRVVIENNSVDVYDHTSDSSSCSFDKIDEIEKELKESWDDTTLVKSDEIDENENNLKESCDDTTLLKRYDVKQFFVGKSYKTEMTRRYSTYNSDYDGNSILLHIKDEEYVFINNEIKTFHSHGKILNFYAPVGNNDVSYPYAIDEYNNIYLLAENVMIPMTPALMIRMSSHDDPSLYYYNIETNVIKF